MDTLIIILAIIGCIAAVMNASISLIRFIREIRHKAKGENENI